jgi:hypothetical protein
MIAAVSGQGAALLGCWRGLTLFGGEAGDGRVIALFL